MYQFTSGAGSPSSHQNSQPMSYKGQQPNQQISQPPPWSTLQPNQPPATTQYGLHRPNASAIAFQACYNCGGFDHWAQNCPEPRRAVPAGAITNQTPYKRQRISGPVVTKYPVPPASINHAAYNQHLEAPRRGLTHPPITQTLQQYPGPPTALSTNANSPWQWPQHGWSASSLHRSHSQDWSLQGLQNPICANDSRRTSSISSVSSGVPQNAFTPQPYVLQNSPASNLSVGPGSSDKTSPNLYQGSSTEARAFSLVLQDDRDQCQQAEASKHEIEEEQVEESWWEELRALDYSEGSKDSKHIVSHPANPVAEPLPCTMTDEDLVARLPIAASVPAGTPVSKYFRSLNVEDFMRNSLDDFKGEIGLDDPAFAVLKDKYEAVSTEELIERRRNMAVVATKGVDGGEEPREHDLKESADSDEVREFDENCGHTDGLPTPCQSQESEEERLAREQEEKLAALGVTGFAKPVRTSVRRSIVPATPAYSESQVTPAEYNITTGPAARCLPSRYSDGETANAALSNGLNGRPPQPSNDAAWEGYRTNGSPTGSHRHATSLQTPPMSAYHDSRSDNNGNCARRFSNHDAHSTMAKSPTAAKDMHSVASTLAIPDSGPGNRRDENIQSRSITKSLAMGYDKDRSLEDDHSGQALSRKRSTREFSAEVDEGPKRQKDEGHQREKPKAPKVAAAYSRRW